MVTGKRPISLFLGAREGLILFGYFTTTTKFKGYYSLRSMGFSVSSTAM
jgi:hypothetical protein